MENSKDEGFIETERNINALLQSMVEGMLIQDKTGKIIQFNQAALEILGLSEEELSESKFQSQENNQWQKMFPGRDHIGMKSIQTGKVQRNIVLQIFRPDGEVRWISLNAVPIFNGDKLSPIQLISTFTDITEMRQVMNDLKQVQLLFNISHDIMIIANQEGYFKRVNPRFINVLGYSLTEVLSLKFTNFIHPDDIETTQRELNKLGTRTESIHFINRYRAKDGNYRVFDWVVVPDNEMGLIYFTARDITDYKADELELIHSSKVYSIGEMTSGIAYSIHGQLAIMAGHISFLQNQLRQTKIDPHELKSRITSVEESIQRLSKTTKDLTSFARTSENEKVVNVSLKRIIDNVLSLCQERFRVHGVRLDIKLDEDLIIRCKESQIAHVFITLLNNAYNVVHTQRDSWVELQGNVYDDLIRINLTDSGVSRSEFLQKTMAIPQGIIEENFGKIYFDSTSPFRKIVIEFPKIMNSESDDED